MIDSIKENLGVVFTARINLISKKANQQGAVTYEFGCNKLPSKDESDKAIKDAVEAFNEALGVKDARVTTLSDFGFATPNDFDWVMS